MKKKKKSAVFQALNRGWDYYVLGKYHCDTCPMSWEECYGEDADAGCYIKGDIQDTCRLLPPFRFLIGWPKRKKYTYYKDHEYDGCAEWYEEKIRKEDAVKELLKKHYGMTEITDYPFDLFFSDVKDVLVPPVQYVPLRMKWNNLIKETFRSLIDHFRPYFSK